MTDLPRPDQTRLLLPRRLHPTIQPGRRALLRTRIHPNHAHPGRVHRHALLCPARAHHRHDSNHRMTPFPPIFLIPEA